MFLRRHSIQLYFPTGAVTSLLLLALSLFAPSVAQAQCLTEEEGRRLTSSLKGNDRVKVLDEAFQKELVELRKSLSVQISTAAEKSRNGAAQPPSAAAATEFTPTAAENSLCSMFTRYGFPTLSNVDAEGVASAFYLFKNVSLPYQLRLIPVIIAATEAGELRKNADYAAFVDRLRLQVGLKQLYGTQAFVREDFLYLAPIEALVKVDERRAEYGLGTLADYMKVLELNYQMPSVLGQAAASSAETPAPSSGARNLQTLEGSNEVIRVETDLVNLNVRVTNKDSAKIEVGLEAKDFRLFEGNQEQEVSFFARTQTPFDLVLLLDLSGSTADKQSVIKKAAKRFIELARPTDRISIVVFTDRVRIVTALTANRAELLKGVGKIADMGGSYVWDALDFTLRYSFTDRPPDRRRAVVMMSDGVDNALMWSPSRGSRISFGQLVENVRQSDVMIVPIFLDTEKSNRSGSVRTYRIARKTLDLLAVESGGQLYEATKIEHLNGVYETVLGDLSTVYSIGYSPSNAGRSGWRSVRVELRGRPELSVRAKPGYYRR